MKHTLKFVFYALTRPVRDFILFLPKERIDRFSEKKKMIITINKGTAYGCQCSAVWCLIEETKSKSKKGCNSEKEMHFELSPLTYSKFQVKIIINNRDITKFF